MKISTLFKRTFLTFALLATTFAATNASTIAELLSSGAGANKSTSGTIVETYARGFLLYDGTGYILTYLGSTHEYVKGDQVTISGTTSTYAGMLQFTNSPKPTITKTGTTTVTDPTPQTLTGADMDALLGTSTVKYVKYTGTLNINGNYYNVENIEGATKAIGSISYPNTGMVNASLHQKKITVTGYFIGTSSSKYFNTMATKVEGEEGGETPVETSKIGDLVAKQFAGHCKVEATLVATYARGFLVSDGTGRILVYTGAASEYAVGDKLTIDGFTSEYAGMIQFGSSAEITKTGSTTVSEPSLEFSERDMDDMLGTKTVQYGQYTGTLSISGNYYNVTIPDCQTAIGSISYPNDGLVDASWDGNEVTVKGYFIGTNSEKYFNTMATSVSVKGEVVDISNTKDNPYSVAEARYLIDQGKGLAQKVYVKGIVAKTGKFNESYGDYSFYLYDEAGSADSLYSFQTKYIDDAKFVSSEQVAEGDEVIIYGNLTLYNNTTYEMTPSTLVSTTNTWTYTEPTYPPDIQNTSFEEWEDGVPVGWMSVASSSADYISQSTDAYFDNYSVALASDPKGSTNYRFASEIVHIGTGWISFNVHLKSPDETPAQFRLGYAIVTQGKIASSSDYKYPEPVAPVTKEWNSYYIDINFEEETDVCFIVMNSKNSKGATLLIDGATLCDPIIHGVGTITPDTEKPIYFDLTGKQVLSPKNGLYIKQTGTKVTKVFIR
ncbi:MAG: hypothetical protein J6T94_03325 [Bacteroidaceae bacterium]|nr:hypothetical protein [Bacteroidaceae bacterium]